MWSPVNLLEHSAKILYLTKRDLSVLDLSYINGKLTWKHRRADFSSVFDTLTRWLQKSVLKQVFQAFKKPHYLWSITSEIFKLWSWTFFPKCSKFHVDFWNPIKIPEKVFDFQGYSVTSFCGKISSLRSEYFWSPSICKNTVLRFQIWIRQMFL